MSSSNTTSQKVVDSAMSAYANRQRLIAEVSQELVSVNADNLDVKFDRILEKLGTFYGADRSYIYLYDSDGRTYKNTHEWCADGVHSVMDDMQDEDLDDYPWWRILIERGAPIPIPDVGDIPDEGKLERDTFLSQGIKSLIVFPISKYEKRIGFWGMDFTKAYVTFEDDEVVFLTVVANIIADVLVRIQSDREVEYLSNLQNLLMNINTRLINITTGNFDEVVNTSLKEIGEFVSADRSYLYLNDRKVQTTSNTHEWCAEGIEPMISTQQGMPVSLFPNWMEQHRRGEAYVIDDVAALGPDHEVGDHLKAQGIRSLVSLPLVTEGELYGFVGFDSVRSKRTFADKETKLLDVFAKALMNSLLRIELMKDLVAAKETAVSASMAKSDFLANMSHEIRTPLNGVIGFTELLASTPLTDEQQRYVDSAVTSAHSLLGIVNDVLDFSKIEVGKMELEEIETDLPELIHQTVEIIKYSAAKKGLKFSTVFDAEVPKFVKVDPVRLKQILVNLLSNAIKFTHQGVVTLSIDYHLPNDEPEGFLTFKVQDTGIGISEDQQHRLFKTFSQADTSTTRKYGGTGLGLVIAQSLANRMGSSIQFTSELGVGSVFFFTLRRAGIEHSKPEVQTNGSQDASQIQGALLKLAARTPTILIAEDVPLNLLLVKTMIGKMIPGATFLEAFDGRLAVEKFAASKPDLLFMDIQMPEMDGYAATKAIRQLERDNHFVPTPIVALTAGAIMGERDKCIAAGMDDYISKPVNRNELEAALLRYLLKEGHLH